MKSTTCEVKRQCWLSFEDVDLFTYRCEHAFSEGDVVALKADRP